MGRGPVQNLFAGAVLGPAVLLGSVLVMISLDLGVGPVLGNLTERVGALALVSRVVRR